MMFWGEENQIPYSKIRELLVQRFVELKLEESSHVHVGIEPAQESDFSVTLRQDESAGNLQ